MRTSRFRAHAMSANFKGHVPDCHHPSGLFAALMNGNNVARTPIVLGRMQIALYPTLDDRGRKRIKRTLIPRTRPARSEPRAHTDARTLAPQGTQLSPSPVKHDWPVLLWSAPNLPADGHFLERSMIRLELELLFALLSEGEAAVAGDACVASRELALPTRSRRSELRLLALGLRKADQMPARWCFTGTERRRLHSIARTCGRPGGFGGLWFWLRTHH